MKIIFLTGLSNYFFPIFCSSFQKPKQRTHIYHQENKRVISSLLKIFLEQYYDDIIFNLLTYIIAFTKNTAFWMEKCGQAEKNCLFCRGAY